MSSAYIVHDNHILALVNAGREWSYTHESSVLDPEAKSFQEIVDILVVSNYDSAMELYEKSHKSHRVFYHIKDMSMYSPLLILQGCEYYESQACYAPRYQTSRAAGIVRAIRRLTLRYLLGNISLEITA